MTSKQPGARVRFLRKAYKLTIAGLGAELGISGSRMNLYELGDRKLPTDVACAIADLTGVTLDWIYRGDPRGLPMGLAKMLDVGMGDVPEMSTKLKPIDINALAKEIAVMIAAKLG